MRTLKFKAQCVFRYRQSNIRRLLPAFDCCRARGDQIVVQSSDNEQSSTVVVSWEDPPNTWLTAAKNAFVGWAFNFGVRLLLKSAVTKLNILKRFHYSNFFESRDRESWALILLNSFFSNFWTWPGTCGTLDSGLSLFYVFFRPQVAGCSTIPLFFKQKPFSRVLNRCWRLL